MLKIRCKRPAVLVHGFAWAERIAEECELDLGVITGPIDILAVHDPCLAWMQFKFAGLEPLPDAIKHVFCLAPALAVKHRIIGVSGKPNTGEMSRHPEIERIVQKQIGQQRRCHSSHNGAKLPFDLTIAISRDRLRPHYRDGFMGAPLMLCRPCNPHRPGHGGADAPAQSKPSSPDGPGQP